MRVVLHHLPAVFRVVVLVVCLATIAGVWCLDRAKAEVSERLLLMGEQVLASAHGSKETLWINGQQFETLTGVFSKPYTVVLDELEHSCTVSASMGALIEHVQESDAGHSSHASTFPLALRAEETHHGFVSCLYARGLPTQSSILSRLEAFIGSGDLQYLGNTRYVYVRKGNKNSQFVAIWIKGTFNPLKAFWRRDDVPGDILQDVPRPAHTQRVLAVRRSSQDEQVQVFQSTRNNASELQRFYIDGLNEQAWDVTSTRDHPVIMAQRNGKQMLLVFADIASAAGQCRSIKCRQGGTVTIFAQ